MTIKWCSLFFSGCYSLRFKDQIRAGLLIRVDLLYRSTGEWGWSITSCFTFARMDTEAIGYELIVDSFLERSTCIVDTANSPSGCHVDEHVTYERASERGNRAREKRKRECVDNASLFNINREPIKFSDATAGENVSMTKEIVVPFRSLSHVLLIKGFVFSLLWLLFVLFCYCP